MKKITFTSVFLFIVSIHIGSTTASVIRFNLLDIFENFPSNRITSFTSDKSGFLWVAMSSGLFRYDGDSLKSINEILHSNQVQFNDVNKLFVDSKNALWINSKSSGLFKLKNKELLYISSIPVTTIEEGFDNQVLIGSSSGLHIISENLKITSHYIEKENSKVFSIVKKSKNHFLVGTNSSLYLFDINLGVFNKINLLKDSKISVYTIHIDKLNNTWLGTNIGLFQINQKGIAKIIQTDNFKNNKIYTIISNGLMLWVGTVNNGLYRININNPNIISNYKSDYNRPYYLSDNGIVKLAIDRSGLLWINTFEGGLNYTILESHKFGLETNNSKSLSCTDSSVIYDINSNDDDNLIISSRERLIKYNKKLKTCDIMLDRVNENYMSTMFDNKGTLWVATTSGLLKSLDGKKFDDIFAGSKFKIGINRIIQIDDNKLLLATWQGVQMLDVANLHIERIPVEEQRFLKADISRILLHKGVILIASNMGLLTINDEGKVENYVNTNSYLGSKSILSIHFDDSNNLWVGTALNGLYKFDSSGNLLKHFNQSDQISDTISINSILQDEFGDMWFGTNLGLIRLDTETYKAHTFYKSDGLQSDSFRYNSAYKAKDGKLYFGGKKGFNAFYPQDITINESPPNIVITELTRFGKPVSPKYQHDDYTLEKDINEVDELILTHKDYVIGFKFSALDFSDLSRNKYAYKMEGLDPEWIYKDSNERSANYSNLKSGNYIFKVKGANKDGVWSESAKALKIKVLPAPWLTWWAYLIYITSFLLILWWAVHRKITANIKLAQLLQVEVTKKTKSLKQKTNELKQQKQLIEDLLDRKNELLENVSHEFRTPLTLILGPINNLLKSRLKLEDHKLLQMVDRNSKRLLAMVEQLLQLARLTNHDTHVLIPQQVQPKIKFLVDSFQQLAASKNISLKLVKNDIAAINATQDVLDLVLGNLISNAIKYTQTGGEVTVHSYVSNNSIVIEVSDTGCGLTDQQKLDIFKRFHRMQPHLNIEGTGIGLSIVKEAIKVNNGKIEVDSTVGRGSKFKVSFNTIDYVENSVENNSELDESSLLTQLLNESVTELHDLNDGAIFIGNKQNKKVLVIDDNQDMLEHVASILKHQYHCMLAPRGKLGVSLAIKYIPDLIISDVMMPEMDGFQVSRIIRSDTRTSHIPLVLLTALNDKKSRIKGWRENIDIYLTKPFDGEELLLQLENILVIRKILMKKAQNAIQSGKLLINSGLPKNDQRFINKFMELISNNYHNPNFLRPQMANHMAVSDRQLQRKLKALIDRNPLDVLRDYRIEKAAKILKDGFQVGITSDKCGFSSVTYFSKCFKDKYGMSPKKYQQTCNK